MQYHNLGWLYQTTKEYERSEEMYLKAIRLKEALLGKDDIEVGLSVFPLAVLYTHNLVNYEQAEELYLRSINISTRLFGSSYDGLRFNYRGLGQVRRP